MSTTPLSPAEERRAKIDEYVVRDALSLVLDQIGRLSSVNDAENLRDSLSSELFDELWPKEDDTGSPECMLAGARVCASAASMLSQIVRDDARDVLLSESVRLSVLAAGHVRDSGVDDA